METISRVRVVLTGLEGENGDLRFSDFITQLGTIQKALVETDRIVSGTKSVYYRVTGLSQSSPATIELEVVDRSPQSRNAARVASTFYDGFRIVQSEHRAPPEYDFRALEALKAVALPIGKTLAGIAVGLNGSSTSLSQDFARTIDEIVGPNEYEQGSVTGWLEKINLHAGQNVFNVYPVTDRPGVRCSFNTSLRERAVLAVDRYVTVYGRLAYKADNPYPHEVKVAEIEIHPPKESLPRLSDMLGIAPDSIEGMSSEDFIAGLRHEWA